MWDRFGTQEFRYPPGAENTGTWEHPRACSAEFQSQEPGRDSLGTIHSYFKHYQARPITLHHSIQKLLSPACDKWSFADTTFPIFGYSLRTEKRESVAEIRLRSFYSGKGGAPASHTQAIKNFTTQSHGAACPERVPLPSSCPAKGACPGLDVFPSASGLTLPFLSFPTAFLEFHGKPLLLNSSKCYSPSSVH